MLKRGNVSLRPSARDWEAAKHSNSFPEPRLRRIRPFSGTAQFCQLILERELHDPELLQLQRNNAPEDKVGPVTRTLNSSLLRNSGYKNA
jgi:hypothetical protein